MIFFLVLLICGCTKVGPDFVRPEAAVSSNWMEAEDRRVQTKSADYRNWWQSFNDPILNGLIDRAYRDNLSLKIAGLRVLEARAQLGVTVGNLYPQTQQVSGSLQYNRLSEQSSLIGPGTSFFQSEIGVNASWELDFWGKFRRAIESANAGLLASLADYDNVLVSLTADVARSYILIKTLEKRIEIARQNVEVQKESLKIAESRFEHGTATQLDVEQAKTVLNDTRASIPALETQLRQAGNALSVLLGVPPSGLADVLKGAPGIPVSPPQVVVGIPADLLRRRPDIRSAELQAAAQCAQIGVAKADLYPAFSLSGMFGFLASSTGKLPFDGMFRWGSHTVQAGNSIQLNIFNYGRLTNNVRVQDARFQQLLITYKDTVLRAQQEVEDSLAAFLKAQDRAGFLSQSVAAARTSLDLALLQYREGTRDFTTVLTAQQALLNEQDNLAITLGTISSSLIGIYRALGGGWDIRQGKDLIPPDIKEEMSKRTNWGQLLTPASYNPLPSGKPPSDIRLPDW
jgi:NodT family efflux transporter outer membrane factor (OMF) lipoprotein